MKQVIASGGGGFLQEKNPFFDCYVLAQANKINPKICFLPTASADDQGSCNHFNYVFNRYPCEPSVLPLIHPEISDFEDFLLSQDIIYVGGGNTKTMLGIWKEWGIDKILRKAYDQGIVLSGMSAGSVCWFDECLSDCYPDRLSILPCLGIIEGANLVHYGNHKRELYHEFLLAGSMKPGYGVHDSAALHYVDGSLLRSISSRKQSKVFKTSVVDNEIVEIEEDPIFLGEEENFKSFILNSKTFIK